jgi:hypothetical protein
MVGKISLVQTEYNTAGFRRNIGKFAQNAGRTGLGRARRLRALSKSRKQEASGA